MPKLITKKTNLDYQNAQPREKPYKITDGDGLFMLVRPSGSKVWQLLYTHGDKNKTYTFGPYLEVTLMQFVKGQKKHDLYLEPRSLITLSGPARYQWTHAIPARKSDVVNGFRFERGRRISLTFRTMIIN